MHEEIFGESAALDEIPFQARASDGSRWRDYPLPLTQFRALGSLLPLLAGDKSEEDVAAELRRRLPAHRNHRGVEMSQKSGNPKPSSERVVRDIRRATRGHYSAEEKTLREREKNKRLTIQNRRLQHQLTAA